MKKNIAVVGCGHWGKNLIRNFSNLGALSAICDLNPELAKSFSQKFKVPNQNFQEIIYNEKIEGIVLSVPAPYHASMAIEAMNAKKHVFVEKPLAMNKDEAESMIESMRLNGVKLMVGHLLQYHPVFKAVLKLVESKKLGSLISINSNRLSFGKIRSEEDVIWSFAPHDISMILSIAGQEPISVKTEAFKCLQPNLSDTADIKMKFKSNLISHISVSWIHPFKDQKLIVTGKDGMIVFDDTKKWEEKLAFYEHKILSSGEVPILKKSEVKYVKVPESEPLNNECKHFLEIIKKNKDPLTDGTEGLKVLKVLSAATLSLNSNREIELISS
jgi:UDP-2-acetamido-3-amino-2,3-dideoxy-glucuronate N-acetyltransferase